MAPGRLRAAHSENALRPIGCFVFIITFFFIFLLDIHEAAAQEKISAQKVWADLFTRSPYPHTLPLPDSKRSPVDGTYVKSKESKSPLVHCLRCPDWAPEGGEWKINFSKGVFRIIHQDSAWRTMGSYFVAQDRILFANDPVCHDVIGLYRWKVEDGRLTLAPVDDGCAIRMRAANLSEIPWTPCQPPNQEAAITDHWPKPPACD